MNHETDEISENEFQPLTYTCLPATDTTVREARVTLGHPSRGGLMARRGKN